MRRLTALLPILFLATACMTAKPDAGPYAAMDCPALEAERLKLVAELNALSASEIARIEATRAQIDAVGAAQVQKGCAG